ncbi:peptidase S8/S53 domain-containing protein [Syncephalis fuscata]|nr:peptidase S8/S53 domain-containing protein [Syncephalis fuscata]
MVGSKCMIGVLAIFGSVVYAGQFHSPPKLFESTKMLSVNVGTNLRNRESVPCAYIVELMAKPETTEAQMQRDAFLVQAKKISGVTVQHTYAIGMNGLSVEFDDNCQNVQGLASLDIVKNIWPTGLIQAPSIVVEEDANGGIGNTGGRAKRPLLERRAKKEKSILSNGGDLKGLKPQVYNTGSQGEGVKIGIVDTGVDYNHPALGGCFGGDCKIGWGYDFVGNNYNGRNKPQPRPDPMDTCYGHGTHVAGIIAGEASNFTGLAPKARIGAYRVLGCQGVGGVQVFLAAMEKAAQDGMQVINLSLGFKKNWPSSPESRMAQFLVERGIIIVASAGNDGMNGMFGISSPATAAGVIAVAAVDSNRISANIFMLSGNQNKMQFPYSASNFVKVRENDRWKVIDIANDDPDMQNGCSSFTGNYTNSFVILDRGECEFSVKILNAQKTGAAGVIIHDTVGSMDKLDTNSTGINIPVIAVDIDTGNNLRRYLKKRKSSPPTIIWQRERVRLDNPNSDSIYQYSSWGPSIDLRQVKPEVTATGGFIISTYPVALGSWKTLSGTSMAAPHISGLAAGMIASTFAGLSPNETVAAFRDAILQTGTMVKAPKWMDGILDENAIIPTIRQGVGRVRARDSNYINYRDAIITNPVRTFPLTNDESTVNSFKFNIRISNVTGRASLEHFGAVTVSKWKNHKEVEPYYSNAKAKVKLSESSFTIKENQMTQSSDDSSSPPSMYKEIDVTVSPPRGLNPNEFYVYSGYIRCTIVDKLNGRKIIRQMVYQSYFGDMNAIPMIQSGKFAPKVGQLVKGVNSIDWSGDSLAIDVDKRPMFVFRLAHPSMRVLAQILDANTKKVLGYMPNFDYKQVEQSGAGIEGNNVGFWDGNIQMASAFGQVDGPVKQALPGKYYIRLLVCSIFSDMRSETSYDEWVSPVITVINTAQFDFSQTGAASFASQNNPTLLGEANSQQAVIM